MHRWKSEAGVLLLEAIRCWLAPDSTSAVCHFIAMPSSHVTKYTSFVYFRSFQGVTIEEAGQHSGEPCFENIATGTIRRRYICVRETIQPG